MFLLVYLSNDTATPSRDVKKKKAPTREATDARGKEAAAIRPLLISASYTRAFGLSNPKEKRRQQAASAFLTLPSSFLAISDR